jgi:hypothetical protein
MSDLTPHEHDEFETDNRGNSIFKLPFQARYPIQGLAYFDRGRTHCPFYGGLGAGLLVEGELDLDRVETAVQHLFNDIDSTRITYPASSNQPLYYRIRKQINFKLEVFFIKEGTFEERVAAAASMEHPFLATLKTYMDVALRVVVYDLGTAPSGKLAWVIAFSGNHLAIDDQGIFSVIDQFMANYRGESQKVMHQVSLMDYLNYMNDAPEYADKEANCEYWRREMAGYVKPSLHESSPDLRSPIDPSELTFSLATQPLKDLAFACQTTLPSLFMAALHLGAAASFNVRDSAVCMLTETRPNYVFWDAIIHGLMSMNHRMLLNDEESFFDFARRTVLKMSKNLQHLVDEEYIGGVAPVYYTYVSPVKSPNLGEGLVCQSWMPDLSYDVAGYIPSDMVAVVEGSESIDFMKVINPAICFFTPNEVRAYTHGVKRSLELAMEDTGVLLKDIVATVQAELRSKGVISD